ncbi:ATP synthase F0, B subunit [Amylolactobacillus amylotrophicus DSM 20534]|uniref:ATP synthase subunit b n=3 Tax=Amylolactobacillus TaxID=2767876 RepID=A0A0R1YKD6_9LACO|nr:MULTISPECIES: F0F1 ATP synthase subunit B [Amylolactobacillus]APT19065.1 ATP synthase F0 subunit B [Amylolactobacillus amylophilus DSM 20533 = JCM 1125]KRK38668.1 ATP synthase F0, B subunit [Amylolactobacillus amylotrophicus DSM 20534]KRM42689.1 ATP synthase F0, B subunit [Amylolactobacillus amylophilus DSM 20533 = JCM 1125]GED79548.1 ATP synthase subunit b [Amylolactobacillus amylophilus]
MILQPLAGMALELGDMLFYLLTFAILMILVGKFAWGPVTAMMEKRREQVTYDLDHAADLNKKATELVAAKTQALQNSKNEAVEIIANAKTNGENHKQKLLNDADKEAAEIREKANVAAVKAKEDALKEARAQVADLSVTIAEKLIQKELSEADQSELIDSFIKGLEKS